MIDGLPIAPEVRQRRLAAIRQAIELGHVGGNEDPEWLLEEIGRLAREIEQLKHARVTKRERREWEDIEGEAATLRGYIREFGETPSMTASSRDHWKNRAEAAEALLTAHAQAIAQGQAALVEADRWFDGWCPTATCCAESGKGVHEQIRAALEAANAAPVSRAPQDKNRCEARNADGVQCSGLKFHADSMNASPHMFAARAPQPEQP